MSRSTRKTMGGVTVQDVARAAGVSAMTVSRVMNGGTNVREETRKAVANEQFAKAIQNIGDVVAYLDQPDFAKFWDEDAKRVEEAVRSIGKV